jgi:hypothetical protein
MFKDISQLLSAQSFFAAGVLTATPTAVTVDLGPSATNIAAGTPGFNALAIYILTGAGGITFNGSNYINWQMQYSDDNSTWTYVPASDVRCGKSAWTLGASGSLYLIQTAHASQDILEVGYIGGHRYIQVAPTFVGTHSTGTCCAAIGICGRPLRAPAL